MVTVVIVAVVVGGVVVIAVDGVVCVRGRALYVVSSRAITRRPTRVQIVDVCACARSRHHEVVGRVRWQAVAVDVVCVMMCGGGRTHWVRRHFNNHGHDE